MLGFLVLIYGTVWEGLGGIILLEKVCHWRQALRFQDSCHSQCVSFSASYLLVNSPYRYTVAPTPQILIV